MIELKQKITLVLDTKSNSNKEMLNAIQREVTNVKKPIEVEEFVPALTVLTSLLNKIKEIKFDTSVTEISVIKEEKKQSLYSEYRNTRDNFEDLFINRIEALSDQIRNEVLGKNTEVKAEFEEGNKVYIDLEDKRKKLDGYIPQLMSEASKYGVTSSSLEFDGSSLTVSDIDSMYEDALMYIKKHSFEVNPIKKIRELIGNKNGEAALLILFIVLLCTPMAELIAVVSLAGIYYNELTWNKKAERCAALLALVFNVKPLEMGYKSDIEDGSLLEVDEAIDNDERMTALMEEYEAEVDKIDEAETAEELWTAIQSSLLKDLQSITSDYQKHCETMEKNRIKYIKVIESIIEKYSNDYDEAKSKLTLLGDRQNDSYVFSTKLMLGLKDGVIPEYVDVGERNIIIRPNQDRVQMRKFLQAMLINAFCNINILKMNVVVCDPNNMGTDLMGAYTKLTSICFSVVTDDLKSSIDKMSLIVKKNMRTLRGRTIQEYNEECEKTGKTSITYNLLFIISQGTTDKVKESMSEFMRNSYQMGVIVWLVSDNDFDNTFVFNKPFDKVTNPYEFDSTKFIIEWADKWGTKRTKAKPPSLDWKDFYERAMKPYKETMWKVNCDNVVMIEPGYVDGDPNDAYSYTVGNTGDIHGFIGGTSGAGKSVFINIGIGNMTKRHGPRDLVLWLADFKGPEFAFYLKTLEHMKVLPHVAACLCTSDPDYAKSLFYALQLECERRFEYITQKGFKNIKLHNEKCREEGRIDDIIPRLVFWCDEFIIIKKTADSKTLDVVDRAIEIAARLGRAAGVHMLFAAQDMKGAMSAGTLANFTLRVGLRCEPEVSQQLLGTPYAGNIRQLNGLLYVGSASDSSKESQRQFKTPYAPDDQLREHIDLCYDKAVAEGFKIKPMIEYQEDTKHPISELIMYYDKMIIPDVALGKTNTKGFIILGNRMSYNPDNMAPINFKLVPKNKSNIIAMFQDYSDLLCWFFSFQYCMSKFEILPQVIYNSQADDLHYLCRLDECVSSDLMEVSKSTYPMADIVKLIRAMYDSRKITGNIDTPVIFILIGWTSAVKFGIDSDDRNVITPITTLLNVIGECNMHIVFVGTAINTTSPGIITACTNKITGKVDKKTADKVMDSPLPAKTTKLKNGYAFYKKGDDDLSKFKIYQTELTREIEGDEYVSKDIMSVI